jgi:hydroxymethylpyrimidine/phosphomethylpyrimidine kinase
MDIRQKHIIYTVFTEPQPLPCVLVFAGHDATGGAGLQADIEALAANGCHALPVLTCVTIQDTRNILKIEPLSVELIREQADTILADIPVAAFKIGLLGNVPIIETVKQIISRYPNVPVIFDPILAAGGGKNLTDQEIHQAMKELLLPVTTLLTPNSQEARILMDSTKDLDNTAKLLLNQGCKYVLITGTHEHTPEVVNILYGEGRVLSRTHWPRLAGSYHGSGCTLASAIAARLAKGEDILTATQAAQAYSWQTLQRGYQPGRGQALPNRLFFS